MTMEPIPISANMLRHNGAEHPGRWRPVEDSCHRAKPVDRLNVGDLVGYHYGVWRTTEITRVPADDLTDTDRKKLADFMSRANSGDEHWQRELARIWPRYLVLEHVSGPQLFSEDDTQRLHTGAVTVHLIVGARADYDWAVMRDPWMTCSCHGHPWPCQEQDQVVMARFHAQRLARLEAGTMPGVCAHCLEPISDRQRRLSFPEPHREFPGAPGPTFHSGRSACWGGAERYERTGRLADNPEATRLASCPGVRFIHENKHLAADARLDCTSGPACTGIHGPAGYQQEIACFTRFQRPTPDGGALEPHPTFDCGYRGGFGHCLGAEPAPLDNGIAADLIWAGGSRR